MTFFQYSSRLISCIFLYLLISTSAYVAKNPSITSTSVKYIEPGNNFSKEERYQKQVSNSTFINGTKQTEIQDCPKDYFRCKTGFCIHKSWICDGINDCRDNSDEQHCFESPTSALCKYGMDMKTGNCSCPGGVCPETASTCSTESFRCNNGICIPKQWQCDGASDCTDGSDEAICERPTCAPNYFVCGDGKCIPRYWRCDFDKDCGDGADELNCPKQNCNQNQFACANGRCISTRWKCDGENDCKDNSDELDCNEPKAPCKLDEFQCSGDGMCIPGSWRCDFEGDCKDGSDELNCTKKTCAYSEFSCGEPNFSCIHASWVCDGNTDCPNGIDEKNCSSTDTSTIPTASHPQFTVCRDTEFRCSDGRTCIPRNWHCDSEKDCTDGSDELNCTKKTCADSEFSCGEPRFHCIYATWVCDGDKDCPNGIDEKNCSNTDTTTIRPTTSHPQFTVCRDTEFLCSDGRTCIPRNWHCDSEKDGSDELNCTKKICADYEFSCGDPNFRCIYASWVCDGDTDCPNGIDEKNCSSTDTTTLPPINPFLRTNDSKCKDWMFPCTNKKCIPYWWKCDTVDDCGDNSDEIACGLPLPTTIRPTTNYPESVICKHTQFKCDSGICIPLELVCDGSRDCAWGEDESQCKGPTHCTDTKFKCRMDGICIDLKDVCNGRQDCPDGSDESACSTAHNLTSGPAWRSCSVGYFPCDGGMCRPLAAFCDGKHDCRDGFDEKNCSSVTRVYQVLQMGVDERSKNQSILLFWWIPIPDNLKLEFLPSISKVGVDQFENKTWTERTQYQFLNLLPFTQYNMTVYVRLKNTKTVFPTARYIIAATGHYN